MPQVFKIGPYWVYFWANESDPLEPVHVHVAEGAPSANATKVWITKAGKCLRGISCGSSRPGAAKWLKSGPLSLAKPAFSADPNCDPDC